MPIPAFDSIRNVLPPHLGNPPDPAHLSPYSCSVEELCERFAKSARRRQILGGFLKLRTELFDLGVRGFHWLDGSFLEDIESQEARDPRDVDVVTFVADPADAAALHKLIMASNPALLDLRHVKSTYDVDHYLIPMGTAPRRLIANACYWYGLFSHRRDGAWKGMLEIELRDLDSDAAARSVLEVSHE